MNFGALPALYSLVRDRLSCSAASLFGLAATLRAGILPRVPAGLLAIAATLTPLAALLRHARQRLAAVPVALALAWLGYAVWSERSSGTLLSHRYRWGPACAPPLAMVAELLGADRRAARQILRTTSRPPKMVQGAILAEPHRGDVMHPYARSPFSRFAKWTAHATGHPVAFVLATVTIVVWLVSGPLFGFSDTWQLVINTGTTIVTFLMVFLIQNTQNRDSAAVHLKLDELVRTVNGAHNALLDLEELTETDLERLRSQYETLGRTARAELLRGTVDTDTPDVPVETRHVAPG